MRVQSLLFTLRRHLLVIVVPCLALLFKTDFPESPSSIRDDARFPWIGSLPSLIVRQASARAGPLKWSRPVSHETTGTKNTLTNWTNTCELLSIVQVWNDTVEKEEPLERAP